MNFTTYKLLYKCTPMGEYACQIPMPFDGRLRGIDFCIADIVAALNAANIITTASCCGHGNEHNAIISLLDGRELRISGHTPVEAPNQTRGLHSPKIYNAARDLLSFLDKATSAGELKLVGSDIGVEGATERLNALEKSLQSLAERGE